VGPCDAFIPLSYAQAAADYVDVRGEIAEMRRYTAELQQRLERQKAEDRAREAESVASSSGLGDSPAATANAAEEYVRLQSEKVRTSEGGLS